MRAVALALAAAALVAGTRHAAADEYEASLRLDAEGGVARLAEPGATSTARVPAAGLAVGASYGLSNLVALEVEAGAGTYGRATYDGMVVAIGGTPQPAGTLARTTRYARATAGATLRFGVAVVPTLGVAAGVGVRLRGGAAFTNDAVTAIAPDDPGGGAEVDLLVAARAGLDVRLGARWVAGATAQLLHAVPLGAPAADAVTVQLHAAYYWYPRW
jgi:hypothetical protein